MQNKLITKEYLYQRRMRAAGYMRSGSTVPNWNRFCMRALDMGLQVQLYEAASTVTKYVTVSDGARHFKVRFGDHAPVHNDCDFYVGCGLNGLSVTAVEDAIEALKKFANERYVAHS